ncbi:MAG: LacI family DNA-binding transcriptional regulator [Xylophilus ampelinus]
MTQRATIRSATLHDVARTAGVSPITASRALGRPDLVSEKTRLRVEAAVQETGYLPNLLAGGLKSRRSLMVAGVVPALSVTQFLPTVQAFTSALAAEGYQVILGQTAYDPLREEAVLNTMISRRPDGIVMTGLVACDRARERLRRSGIPVVETWDLSDDPVDMLVGFSHDRVGRALGAFFRERGWERVGVATGGDPRALRRRDGFAAALGREPPTACVPAPSSLELGRRALAELLAQDPALEAVCCSSDTLAHGVIVEALARGMRVPEDLAVSGFGDAEASAHLLPSITSVHVDGPGIGRRAAGLILARCRGEAVAEPVVDLGFELIERASTAGR